MSAEAAAVARRAAEIVQQRGHCKGRLHDNEGRVCLHGALEEAAFELTRRHLLPTVLRDELRAMFPDERTFFPGSWFNDRADTDETDVAKVLLQVADRLDVSRD